LDDQIEAQMGKEDLPKKWFLATALALAPMPAAAHDEVAVSPRSSQPSPTAQRMVVGLPTARRLTGKIFLRAVQAPMPVTFQTPGERKRAVPPG
jgi:hypothetical protein